MGIGLPLAAARLLFEIGSQPADLRSLRSRLGLDSGYLSRLLRALERQDLVVTAPDPGDRRRRIVSLTAAGRARHRTLEHRSEERARELIAPLGDRQRACLAAALAQAGQLVRAATVSFEDADAASAPARQALNRYFTELHERFGFDATDPSAVDLGALSPPRGVFVIARSDGLPVACGGVQTLAPAVGEVKRMWVERDWRGAGLGGRLLRQLEERARDLGHRAVRLDSNRALTEAIAMYQRAGYRPIARYNDNPHATHFFEKLLTPVPRGA